MAILQAIPRLLAHLRSFGQGEQLKREAMSEVQHILRALGLSRRQFLRAAAALGYPFTSITSLGNWISCKYLPTLENVDLLIEALEAVLREHGGLSATTDQLRAASAQHDHELRRLQLQIEDVEQARALLEDTLAWIHLSEFPPAQVGSLGSFVPIARQHSIQRLNLLRAVHGQALDHLIFPKTLPHALIVAAASIVGSHYLTEIGDLDSALEAADEGVHVLTELFQHGPRLRGEPVIGQPWRTWGELAVIGLEHQATVLKNMAHQARDPASRSQLLQFAGATLQTAMQRADELPQQSKERYAPGVLRDRAEWLIQCGGRDSSLQDAEQLARLAAQAYRRLEQVDDALLYYLCQVTLAKALIAQGKLSEAAAALEQARAAETQAQRQQLLLPGPLHRLIFLRVEGSYYLERARGEGRNSSERKRYKELWRQTISQSLKLAQWAGLTDQEHKIHTALRQVENEFRRLLSHQNKE